MSASGRNTVAFSTSLEPEFHAALSLLVALERPATTAANRVLRRLIHAELERVAPGAWNRILAAARELPQGLTPRQESEGLLERIGGVR